MSTETVLVKLTENLLLDILEGALTAAAAGMEHTDIKAAVRAKISDPSQIPAELRRIRDEAISKLGDN